VARAQTVTKLSIDRWAELIGIHPLHFNQTIIPTMPPTVCSAVWVQHPWQDVDRIGREDLALAIRLAEDDIERELKSRLLPSWEIDEWRPTERIFRPELFNLSSTDIRGFHQIATARWMNFITGGIQAKTLVEANSPIVYSDANADGYDETATVTATVDFVDSCEVYIYYPGKAGDDAWEIRPTTVDIDVVTSIATIVFRRELVVLEDLMEAFDVNAVDGTNDSNFLTTVDVYRKYNDPQRQVQFLWEARAGCLNCNGTGCAECAYNTQEGCLVVRGDPRLSMVSYHPATWNADTLEFDSDCWSVQREPDILRLWYYAGIRDKSLSCNTRRMSPNWERAVAFYAASLLDRPLCECNNVSAWVKHWRRDLAIGGEGSEERTSVDEDLLGNPFGTRRGAVFAWQQVVRSRELPQEIAI